MVSSPSRRQVFFIPTCTFHLSEKICVFCSQVQSSVVIFVKTFKPTQVVSHLTVYDIKSSKQIFWNYLLTLSKTNPSKKLITSSNQVKLGQFRFGQFRLGQVWLGQVSLGQVRFEQGRLGQVMLGQVKLGQVRLGQV